MANTENMEKLLYTQEEAAALLDVCLKYFKKLPVQYVRVGKRKKYAMEHLKRYIQENSKGNICPSTKEKGRRSTNTTSRSTVADFEVALERTIRT